LTLLLRAIYTSPIPSAWTHLLPSFAICIVLFFFLPRIQFYLCYVLWFNVYCLGCVCQPFNKRIMYVCMYGASESVLAAVEGLIRARCIRTSIWVTTGCERSTKARFVTYSCAQWRSGVTVVSWRSTDERWNRYATYCSSSPWGRVTVIFAPDLGWILGMRAFKRLNV